MLRRLVNRSRFEPGSSAWYFRRDRVGMISLAFVIVVALAASIGPLLTPYAAEGRGVPNTANKILPPSLEHPFGTDLLGRDMLARVIYGARIALLIAVVVNAVAIVVGVVLGAVAGFFGGWIDDFIMRVTDIFLAFPPLLLAIVIAAALGANLVNTILAITLVWWPWYTRLVRGQAVSIRERNYVRAARSIGVPVLVIVRRHIVPNVLTPVFVQASIDMGSVILVASALAFIGLGPQPPMADWGLMVNEGRPHTIAGRWWISTFPGLALFFTALAFSLLGDSARDAGDPRLRSAG